jgi:carbonic anhydrase
VENLLRGIVEFRNKDFEEHRELFHNIRNQQKPHTLFIGCSDSRVVPNFITKTMPGEIFVVRNVANLIPIHSETTDFYGVASAIEFAVLVLNVENIVVCGHSNCGGCASLYKTESELSGIPLTKKWLELAKPVRDQVIGTLGENPDPAAREWLTEQINVVEQLKHLLTYPYIRERFCKGKLNLLGWYYIIETGEIFGYNREKGFFEIIN